MSLLGSFMKDLLHIGQMKQHLAYLHVRPLSSETHPFNCSPVFLEGWLEILLPLLLILLLLPPPVHQLSGTLLVVYLSFIFMSYDLWLTLQTSCQCLRLEI